MIRETFRDEHLVPTTGAERVTLLHREIVDGVVHRDVLIGLPNDVLDFRVA